MDADSLIEQAEKFLFDGDNEHGMPLVYKALDLDPTHAGALDNLATSAGMEPDKYGDELLKRLGVAVERASGPRKSELAWARASQAAFLNKQELLAKLVDDPALAADHGRDAQRGALLVELGRAADGEKLLHAVGSPLANYHLGRLAERAGRADEAKKLFEKLPKEGADGILRDIGLATLALKSGGGDKLADALFKRAEDLDLPMPIVSEGIILRIRVALARHDKKETSFHAVRFGASASKQDPSALLRATALVGPLYKIKLEP